MDKEKLTKKIKKLSKFTYGAMVIYFLLNCCDIWPEGVKRHNIDMDIKDMSALKAVFAIAALFFLVVSVVGMFISAMKTMSYLSKGRTPFTKKLQTASATWGYTSSLWKYPAPHWYLSAQAK
jgi:hypothetical protein